MSGDQRAPSLSPAKRLLTSAESARLAELEPIIERGMASFVEVGNALLEISDRRLYRETHSTFEEYCRNTWSMSARHAYRLCESAEIIKSLPEKCDQLVTTESQVRELAKVKPEQRAKVLEVAASKGKVTAKSIQIAVEEQERPQVVAHVEVMKPDSAPQAREFKPRLKCKTDFLGWWHKSSKVQRAEFLPWLFTTKVVVANKADIRKDMDRWFEQYVTEAAA
jgi:hypothetical protein